MKYAKLTLAFVLLTAFSFAAHAQSGSIKLVSTGSLLNETVPGGVPEMFLDVRPGSGNVYIESFPLTKVDTQISTRFAKAVACDFLEIDCAQYDFFYKMRADANIIGGPSAGGAITVLTVAVLDSQQIDQSIAMTGTINSGGLIGPVGGLREKALAAENDGLKMVIVPKLSVSNRSSFDNLSEGLSIQIAPVSSLEEALFYFTGKNYSKNLPELLVPDSYKKTMQSVADKLCAHYSDLEAKLDTTELESSNNSLYSSAKKFMEKAKAAKALGDDYSRASFCFSGSLALRDLYLEEFSNENLEKGYKSVVSQLNDFEQDIDNRKFNTLSDLETYMIVNERVQESKSILEQINSSNVSSEELSYAYERLYSGVYWSDFFGLPGEKFVLENQKLKESCESKISEASERINYVALYFPASVSGYESGLREAFGYLQSQDYALCLFKASKVKADADMLFTVLFIDEDQVGELVDEKISQAEKVLAIQQSKGKFPILGYSYYEYAQSLKEDDPYSALRYLEYSLELSNLDMYFPPEENPRNSGSAFEIGTAISSSVIIVFLLGTCFGIVLGLFFVNLKKDFAKQKKKTQKDSKKSRNLPGKKR